MKIGILTFFRPINHGAVFQSCALSNIVLKKLGHETQLIDYRLFSTEHFRKVFCFDEYPRITRDPITFFRMLTIDIILAPRRALRKRKFDCFIKRFLNTSKTCYDALDIVENTKDYDLLIVGSDLVWNPEMTGGINPIYYLQFSTPKQKRISYAASIGLTALNSNDLETIGSYLNTFSCVSVRENSAKNLLEPFVKKSVSRVLDPTLLTSASDWTTYMNPNYKRIKEKYLFVYMLEMSEVLIKTAKEIAEHNNLRIVTYGSKKRFGREAINVYNAGPDEFLSVIANAEMIVTNSFHGCAFSLLYKKQFWCIPHTTRGTRMTDLLSDLDLKKKIVLPQTPIDYSSIDYELVDNKLEELKKQSNSFLDQALRGL